MQITFALLSGMALLAGSVTVTTVATAHAGKASQAGTWREALPPSREQMSAASMLAKAFASTWNRRDGHGYGDAYWPDAELVDPSGQVWNGRDAIIQTHVDLWAGPAKATHMTAHVRRVRALAPNLFVVDIDTSATGFSPPPPGAPDGIVRSRLKHVVERRGAQWKILSSQNTFISER